MTQLSTDPVVLFEQAASGSRVALARLLTMVERGGATSEAVAALSYQGPIPYTVGLTGAPGAGKSTLTDQLITTARGGWPAARAQTAEPLDQVAVLAIDPSSPFTGGAILGDRVRMQGHATDPTVFIRSMATRGHLGGLSLAADIFVINKADRPGVKEARRDLEQMLDLSHLGNWRPPIVETVAAKGEGTEAFWATVADHRAYLIEANLLAERRKGRLDDLLAQVVAAMVERRVGELRQSPDYEALMQAVTAGSIDPYGAAHQILGD